MDFIVSTPRSGTTWLAGSLSLLSEVFVSENRLFGDFFDTQPGANGRETLRVTADAYVRSFANHFCQFIPVNKGDFREHFTTAYIEFLQSYIGIISPKAHLIDKVTPYPKTSHQVLAKIRKYFPDAKIIHLVRDGRDVVTSGVFDWLWREDPIFERHALYVHRNGKVRMNRFFDDKSLESWINHWSEVVIEMEGNSQKSILIKYEDMIRNLHTELERICDWIGVAATTTEIGHAVTASGFQKLSGRLQGQEDPKSKMRKGIVGDWRRFFTKRDGMIFHELAGDLLLKLGYVKAEDWFLNLPVNLNFQLPNEYQ